MKVLLAIFIGGGLGSVARYLTGKLFGFLVGTNLPFGTFAANVLSCVILGIGVSLIAKEQLTGLWIPFLIIGFCGGFSTFSTFSYETLLLLNEGKWWWAGANIAVSLITCIIVLIVLTKQLP
jgi:CrcB protein